uniref:Uncharacterized protein n=1 Tax=Anopheles darlingi TaxID=43151 RepID=A0A2M4D834_ANODA
MEQFSDHTTQTRIFFSFFRSHATYCLLLLLLMLLPSLVGFTLGPCLNGRRDRETGVTLASVSFTPQTYTYCRGAIHFRSGSPGQAIGIGPVFSVAANRCLLREGKVAKVRDCYRGGPHTAADVLRKGGGRAFTCGTTTWLTIKIRPALPADPSAVVIAGVPVVR